tara:strand:+ start:396 stop:1172 length:777 start_codon:yes stop_codon:yes gene_type:complete
VFEYPNFLSPIAFELFGLTIRWYSISYILGFSYFYFFALNNLKQFNLDKKKLEDLFFYLFLSVIIGGRLGYVIFYNLDFYFQNPLNILKVWQGGMSFHGALIGITLTIILFSRQKNISIFQLSDLLSITAPVGIFLGRVSNFLNKELIGKPTEFFLSVRYPNEDLYRHISQIYEAVFEGLLPAILLISLYYKFKIKDGLITSLFLINYGLSRIIIENFREPDIQLGLKFDLLSQGQLLSIPIIILGFYFLYICQYKKK